MDIIEIMRAIHEEGVENEIFELLTEWMITNRFENTLRIIYKILTQNENAKNAILENINLSEGRMTKDEAIEILEKEKAYMLGHGGDRQAVALDMAIKALEQEPIHEKIGRGIKLEIDIPSIVYKDAKENRNNYISVSEMEIAWKAIADGKPLEQEPILDNNSHNR